MTHTVQLVPVEMLSSRITFPTAVVSALEFAIGWSASAATAALGRLLLVISDVCLHYSTIGRHRRGIDAVDMLLELQRIAEDRTVGEKVEVPGECGENWRG